MERDPLSSAGRSVVVNVLHARLECLAQAVEGRLQRAVMVSTDGASYALCASAPNGSERPEESRRVPGLTFGVRVLLPREETS